MYELRKTPEVQSLLAMTKSDSGISGASLAAAHMELGRRLGAEMSFDPADTTVVAILRGGMFFASGLYLQLGCRFAVYDPKRESFVRPDTKYVILTDSVVNTGATILPLLTPNTVVACCVASERAVEAMGDVLYAARVSRNSYVGSAVKVQRGGAGPDTTMRLFGLI